MEKERSGSEHALIIGSGITGPALGMALRHAGIDPVVYEANPVPRDEAGAFLSLAPNGLSVLPALGVANLTNVLGFQNDRLVFHNDTGRVLADVPVGGVTSCAVRSAGRCARRPLALVSGSSSARPWRQWKSVMADVRISARLERTSLLILVSKRRGTIVHVADGRSTSTVDSSTGRCGGVRRATKPGRPQLTKE